MKFPKWLDVYGDQSFRGQCPTETAEQITFFNYVRRDTEYGLIALHPRNEGKRTVHQTQRQKAEGMAAGAPDIVIPAWPAFVCELKRQDHTKSHWQPGQVDYLEMALSQGAFVCLALGADAAIKAMEVWHYGKEKEKAQRRLLS